MNTLDTFILGVTAIGALWGLYKGFVSQAVWLSALIFTFFFASAVSPIMVDIISSHISLPAHLERPIGYIALFIVIFILARVLILILHKSLSAVGLSVFNHLSGALLGGLKVILIISVCLNLLSIVDRYVEMIPSDHKQGSIMYTHTIKLMPGIYEYLVQKQDYGK